LRTPRTSVAFSLRSTLASSEEREAIGQHDASSATTWTRRVVYLLVCLALLVAGYVAGLLTQPTVYRWFCARAYAKNEARFLNRPAPDFRATTIDGSSWELSKQRGKVVILDFTASWCMPCVGAYPLLKSVHDAHRESGKLSILSVALDEKSEDVKKHFSAYGLPWPVANEDGKTFDNSVARKYHVKGIPSIWIIDQHGRVAAMDAWGEAIGTTVDRLLRQTG